MNERYIIDSQCNKIHEIVSGDRIWMSESKAVRRLNRQHAEIERLKAENEKLRKAVQRMEMFK